MKEDAPSDSGHRLQPGAPCRPGYSKSPRGGGARSGHAPDVTMASSWHARPGWGGRGGRVAMAPKGRVNGALFATAPRPSCPGPTPTHPSQQRLGETEIGRDL